jgi:hypothetical protein
MTVILKAVVNIVAAMTALLILRGMKLLLLELKWRRLVAE